MKKTIWFLLTIPISVFAFENSMLNLSVPSSLETGQMRFSVQHRFYGKFDDKPMDTFFGMTYGANTGLGLKVALGRHIEASTLYIFNHKEYHFGLSADFPLTKWLRSQLELRYFSFRPTIDQRVSNVYCQLALESRPIAKRFIPVINLGYDGYHEKMGCGLGLSISILEKFSLIGEYFPVIEQTQDEMKNSYTFGFRIRTYGHFFLFQLGNNVEIGTRQLMRGATNHELHFGFTIQRLIE